MANYRPACLGCFVFCRLAHGFSNAKNCLIKFSATWEDRWQTSVEPHELLKGQEGISEDCRSGERKKNPKQILKTVEKGGKVVVSKLGGKN